MGRSQMALDQGEREVWIPSDLVGAVALIAVYVCHVSLILGTGSPFGGSLCCLTPWDGILWLLALAIWSRSMVRAFKRAGPHSRLNAARVIAAVALSACTADKLSGGDYRYFSITLDRRLRVCGGPAGLQTWSQQFLAPDHLSQDRNPDIDLQEMPAAVQQFAKSFRLHEFVPRDDQSYVRFNEESAYLIYGVIVGRTDLDRHAFGSVVNSGWVGKIRPGVFYFATQ